MSIRDAARAGHQQTLEASRDVLAQAIEEGRVPGYKLADALRSLSEIVGELEAMKVLQEKGDAVGQATQVPPEAWTPTGGAQGHTP